MLQKFPVVRQLCRQRESSINSDPLSSAQDSIADAINGILNGANGADRAKVEIAVTHLAMAHVFAQSMKRQEKS